VAPGRDDSFDFEITADGRDARQELASVLQSMRALAAEATRSGAVVDKSTQQQARSYGTLARELGVVEKAALQTERALAQQAASRDRARGARANANTAEGRQASSAAVGANNVSRSEFQAEAAMMGAITAERRAQAAIAATTNKNAIAAAQIELQTARAEAVIEQSISQSRARESASSSASSLAAARERVALRQQENKDLIAQGQITLLNDRSEEISDRRQARAMAERQKALQAEQRSLQQLQATERSRAIQSERNARAIAGGSTTERTSALAAERMANPLGDISQINATRYALGDTAQTAALAGAAVASVGVASIVVATQFEASFADVQRAAELTGGSVQAVRNDLLDITKTMPTNFADVAGVAQLGAQMNIAERDLDSFATVVSQFAATTDVSTEQTAISFGRISNLLDVNPADFDKLGSSIYDVGIKSVATESEILSTTQQIAGAAAAYNFTADQVVGLGAAFASLAIAPEAARGSVTRIFGDIEKAVATGGEELEEYARIMRVDVADATQLWQADPSAFFQKLVQGLSQSKSLIQDLGAIGANDVRDQNLLQRLAGNPELLANSLNIASDAFDEGTALADGYAYTIDTLAAKLKILLNNVQALAAGAGTPLLGPLGVVVDMLSAFIGLLSENTVLAGFVVALSLLVGGVLLMKGAIAAAMAGLLAMKFVMDQLSATAGVTGINLRSLASISRVVAGQFGLTNISIAGVTARLREMDVAAAGAGRSQSALRGGLQGVTGAATAAGTAVRGFGKATLVLAALQIGTELLGAGIEKLQYQFASAGERAESYFGDVSGFSDAVAKDTAIYNETGEAIAVYARSTGDAGKAATEAAPAVETWIGLQSEVPAATNAATAATEEQTFALGENARAWVQNAFAAQESIQQFANNPALVEGFNELGGSVDELLAQSLQGTGSAYVQAIADRANEAAAQLQGQLDQSRDPAEIAQLTDKIALYDRLAQDLPRTLGAGTAAVEELAQAEKEGAATSEFLGQKIAETGDEAEAAGGDVSTLSDELDKMFGTVDAGANFATSLQALFSGIKDGGTSFDYLSESGRTNLSNLRDSIEATVAYGETMGLSTAESIQQLFAELQAQGVDTASLIQQLSLEPYMFTATLDDSDVRQKLVNIGTAAAMALTGKGNIADIFKTAAPPTQKLNFAADALRGTLSNVAQVAPRAAKGVDKAAEAAEKAAKKVVTLNDYMSDLQGVFSDATSYRFGVQDGLDEVAGKWADINDEIKQNQKDVQDAQRELRDYRVELGLLRSDLSQQKYFLRIAVQYGDTLRAEEISAEIAKTQADIADKSGDVADAQREAAAKTDMSSMSYREQRESLSDLYGSYQQIILEYARSGASQEQLRKKTEELRSAFVRQAQQAGYSNTQIQRYSVAFNDLTYAISKVPRNVNVAMNANPAVQAANDFRAKLDLANDSLNKLRKNSSNPISAPTVSDAALQRGARAAALQQEININLAKQGEAMRTLNVADTVRYGAAATNAITKLRSGNYADGGFVPGSRPGDRRVDNVNGVLPDGSVVGLQGGEPIINNRARDLYGDKMFEQINSLKFKPQITPNIIVQGGSGGGDGPTFLSAQDRLLLQQIRDRIGLSITGNALQSAVGAANRTGSIRKDS